jgi:hypothetical protein
VCFQDIHHIQPDGKRPRFTARPMIFLATRG